MRCLVTGATGYVGGRLVPRLLAAGHEVRCLTRDPRRLRDVPWAGEVEIVTGDVTDAGTLGPAFEAVDVVYYLVHSLGRRDFEAVDRTNAANVAGASRRAGVARIVYLGGPEGGGSAHLRSRGEVAEILLASGVPTVVLRAAVIVGSGSASFEMLRYLTERLPVMVTPRWVSNRIQPIAIRDVLRYLVAAAGAFPPGINRAFDIGGPDVLTYAEMMHRYAAVAGLRRRMIMRVRPLTPGLSALWVGLVTPVPNAIARPLVAGLVEEAVCGEHDIARYVPDPPEGLTGFDDAVTMALRRVRDADADTGWAGATRQRAPSEPLPTDPAWSGGTVYTDDRERPVDAPAGELWQVIAAIGGEGPDRWRVEEIVPGELLRLRAAMRLPGRAWLELRACPGDGGHSRYRQRAVFLPRGLAGLAYRASVWPLHTAVFARLARDIARAAERRPAPRGPAQRGPAQREPGARRGR
jgi:uncharacterized protein YbjT (DUF2867 family)